MRWLEFAEFVGSKVSAFTYGTDCCYLLIIENPDCEGGGYDVYSSNDYAAITNAAREIEEKRLLLDNLEDEIRHGGSFRTCIATR